jgi:hypothetical protein
VRGGTPPAGLERSSARARSSGIGASLAIVGLIAACATRSDSAVVVHGEKGPVRVSVELATTPQEQARGLMWRERLEPDHGMLFVFEEEEPLSFWMKNTPLPLDIIYIDRDGVVVSIARDTIPFSTATIPSHAPAKYVLEVVAGFARRHGVELGTKVELPVK